MPVGRPTDFKPEYGEQILELMEAGLSLAASAAEIGVHRRRVYDWVETYPDFKELVDLAKVKRQLFLERRLLETEKSPIVTSTIFALKNAGPQDWRDKQEVDHKSSDGSMSPDATGRDLGRTIAFALAQADTMTDDSSEDA